MPIQSEPGDSLGGHQRIGSYTTILLEMYPALFNKQGMLGNHIQRQDRLCDVHAYIFVKQQPAMKAIMLFK